MRSDGLSAPVTGSERASRAAEGGRGLPASAGAGAGAAPVAPLEPIDPIARARAVAADAAALDRGAMPLRAGDGEALAREPGAQLRLGRLQQGLDYLDRLSDAMQRLKGGLSQSLARASMAPANAVESGTPAVLQAQLDQLRQLWSQRPGEAAGRVDADLQAAPEDGSARQRFKVRGLDLAVLQQGGRETLRLQLPGQRPEGPVGAMEDAGEGGTSGSGKPVLIAVTLAGEGTQDQLQALTRALLPAGLSVQAQGADVIFSVAESRWPALRDGMTLRGEGRRFPSGQPVRALLEPTPEALQPQRWTLQDAPGQRHALGQLLQAQPKLAQARARLNEQLEAAARPNAAMAPDQAQALAGALTGALSGAEYSDVGALLPALRGLHRQRVRQLLG